MTRIDGEANAKCGWSGTCGRVGGAFDEGAHAFEPFGGVGVAGEFLDEFEHVGEAIDGGGAFYDEVFGAVPAEGGVFVLEPESVFGLRHDGFEQGGFGGEAVVPDGGEFGGFVFEVPREDDLGPHAGEVGGAGGPVFGLEVALDLEGGDDGVSVTAEVTAELAEGAAFEFGGVGEDVLDVGLEFGDEGGAVFGFVGFEGEDEVLELEADGHGGIAFFFVIGATTFFFAFHAFGDAFGFVAVEFLAVDVDEFFAVGVEGEGSGVAPDGGAEFLEDGAEVIVAHFVDLTFELGELLGDHGDLLGGERDGGALAEGGWGLGRLSGGLSESEQEEAGGERA